MRIAVLADIHGNLPALRAVLRELDADSHDGIVVAGDIVAGPLVRQPLELLASRTEPVHWLRGNCEREAVAAFDGVAQADDQPGRDAAWSARALDRRWRDKLESWPVALSLDSVLFCHGSPRSDEELITRLTPDGVLLDLFAGVSERLVVGGHTHQQMVRPLDDGLTYANAGSVGLPYEGRAGAFWMTVDEGVPEPRETSYDLDAALEELRASRYSGLDELLKESLVEPLDPSEVSAFFERAAGR
jgi:predicted phosphodiesterase